jgi:uroporphyrinogen-III decarboxylase
MSGTDFGSQNGLLISPDFYRTFYKPYHKKLNAWVHKNTRWKVFFHSCGSIIDILSDFIEAEVDILNPVQYTAKGMELKKLKREYGDKVVFWGGGIDTQKTLPFGTVEDVIAETEKNINILSCGSGYVCSAVHNIQYQTPLNNIKAFFNVLNGKMQ